MERRWRARTTHGGTNALLATGAALFVLLSAYGFTTPAPGGARVVDPTRDTDSTPDDPREPTADPREPTADPHLQPTPTPEPGGGAPR